jgi:hypothetical protein
MPAVTTTTGWRRNDWAARLGNAAGRAMPGKPMANWKGNRPVTAGAPSCGRERGWTASARAIRIHTSDNVGGRPAMCQRRRLVSTQEEWLEEWHQSCYAVSCFYDTESHLSAKKV